MKSSSKVFPQQNQSQNQDEVRQWLPPDMNAGKQPVMKTKQSHKMMAPPTAAELEAIQQEAYTEGFEKGKEEGFAFGHKEGVLKAQEQMRNNAQRMEQLFTTLSEPLRELDDQVEKELLNLVIAIVRQLIRREVKSDPHLIIGVVREALSILPVASRNVRLIVHPEDGELIREVYALGETEVGWTMSEDPVINRGGCKVVTETSQIDATLESRLATLIAPLLASARSVDELEDQE